MKKEIEDVKKFHDIFDHPIETAPGIPDKAIQELRERLIAEELAELKNANANNDLTEAADALIDLLYVTYGALICYGLGDAADELFNEVQASNMSKLDENGNPVHREDGKIMKGPDYFTPDLKSIIEKYQRRQG